MNITPVNNNQNGNKIQKSQQSFSSIRNIKGTKQQVSDYIEKNVGKIHLKGSMSSHNGTIVIDNKDFSDFFKLKCGITIPDELFKIKTPNEEAKFFKENPEKVKTLISAMSQFLSSPSHLSTIFDYANVKKAEGKVQEIIL